MARRGARNRCSPLKKTDYCVEKAERKYFVWRFSQAQFSRRLHFSQKKGIALVLHFSYFFLGDGLKPKKQGSSRGPAVSLESVTRPAKKPKRSSQVFSARAFISQPAAGGVEKDRPNLSFASRSVGGLDASARSSADGNDRLASRRVLDSRAFPGARRVPRERGDASRDRAHRVIIFASSANDGCVETRDARLFVGCPISDDDARRGVFRTQHEYHVCGVFS